MKSPSSCQLYRSFTKKALGAKPRKHATIPELTRSFWESAVGLLRRDEKGPTLDLILRWPRLWEDCVTSIQLLHIPHQPGWLELV